VRREQELLAAHDVVVLQHPFYWYSTPPLIKQWEDLVLEHGWAYGTGGTALHGKWLLSAISAGGPRRAYRAGGYQRFTIRQLLAPLEQTARLCGMEYLPPFVVFGTHQLGVEEIGTAAAEYGRLIQALRDDRVDLDWAQQQDCLGWASSASSSCPLPPASASWARRSPIPWSRWSPSRWP
jgi:glutathione-regulated potassium-efflux system ancillary protein KefG